MTKAIVVGAGPTASLYYDWIKRHNHPVIAVSTIYKPLLTAGILPDVTVILDCSAGMVLHFSGVQSVGQLAYAEGVPKAIPANWTGSKFAMIPAFGSSVIHAAIGLANAEEIHLIGVDFCYVDNKSHAEGVVTRYDVGRKECIWERNGYGKEVLTDRDLLHYRKDLESWLLSAGAGIRVIKHGRGGLPVRGTVWADD